MKLVSVHRALKELQNDTLFSASCLVQAPYLVKFTSRVCICIYKIGHSLTKKVSFCSSFKALSTETSYIKIGVCYQKLSTLEFNSHYRLSSHCLITNLQVGWSSIRWHLAETSSLLAGWYEIHRLKVQADHIKSEKLSGAWRNLCSNDFCPLVTANSLAGT